MDRLIEVKVSGNYLRKDTNRAGVQGEANVTTLRITFDESWDGYTKTLTWWDACGENPVVIELLPNLLEDAADSTRIYRCLIPAEPLAVAGWCSFVIDGYIDGKRQRTVEDKLQVRYAPSAEGAGTPAEITPTVIEQLQLAIEELTGDIQLAAQVARSVERMTASAETGEPGSNATVEKSTGEDGGLIFTFRIPRGDKGEPGIPGKDGKDGADGQDGAAFTYDMFTPEQLEALRGPQGIQGPIGQTGEPGPRGVQGEKGDKGDKGDKGEPGEDGTNGKDGETGPAGADGKDGAQGQRGTGILKVTTAPKTYNITSGNGHYSSFGLYLSDVLNQSGATEVLKGDIILYQDRLYTVYSVGLLGTISFVHTSSSYVSIRGADGETGPAGADGAPGADGVSIQGVSFYPSNEDGGENEVGLEFSDGSYWSFPIRNGSKGSTGDTGSQGPAGPAGATGEPGVGIKYINIEESYEDGEPNWIEITMSDGEVHFFHIFNGKTGATGPEGPQGPQGIQGEPGADGAKGDKGDTGAQGPAGADGKNGYTPVKGTDYFTEADKAELVEEITGQLGQADTIPDYWQSHIDSKITAIKALQDTGGKDCFSFISIADMHYTANLGKNAPVLANAICEACDIPYILLLGDTRTRGLRATKEEVLTEFDELENILKPIRDRTLQTQGNHDAGYARGDYDGDGDEDTYAFELTHAEMFNRIYRKVGMVGDVHFDASGSGYWIDDVSNRVRYIILNTQNNSEEKNADGTSKYPSMWFFRFCQSQFDLTIEALNTVPSDDWAVVVAGHCPITQEIGDREVMQGVLNAYKGKTTYTGEYAGTAVGGPAYTNKAEPLPDNTTDTTKWCNGYRFGSSGVPSAESGTTVSNRIACKAGDVIRIKGATLRESKDRIVFLDADDADNTGKRGYFNNGIADHVTYDGLTDGVYQFTILSSEPYGIAFMRFAMQTPADASVVIVTVNQEITEGGGTGYDYVSVDADFTDAKGNLVGYFAGHTHSDTVTDKGVKVITTRCDAAEENVADLKAERVAGTTTEQSFDVFTVNKAERRIYATKIGAGSDRVISY